jgi:hypothetical protein
VTVSATGKAAEAVADAIAEVVKDPENTAARKLLSHAVADLSAASFEHGRQVGYQQRQDELTGNLRNLAESMRRTRTHIGLDWPDDHE